MRRDQLEHAIRTACQIIEQPAVVVVGSQAILGTFTEDQLPPEATMSIEVDILPMTDDNAETARLADRLVKVQNPMSTGRPSRRQWPSRRGRTRVNSSTAVSSPKGPVTA
jgi:hypothetical protein